MINCPICEASTLQKKYDLYDDRHGYPGRYPMIQCQNCSHCFIDIFFSSDEISNLYTSYYPRRTFNIDLFTPVKEVKGLRSWLNGEKRSAYCWVPPQVRILDIGCGFGETLAYHSTRGCDAYGVEADENAKRASERYGLKIQIGIFDAAKYPDNYFDFVTMDQVIEHMTYPKETLLGISRILKKGGTLILSTPNVNGWGENVFGHKWINWHTPYHLHLFSKQSMIIAAQRTGFVVQPIQTITSSEWLYYQLVHLISYPSLGTPSLFWSMQNDSVWGSKKIFLRRFFKMLHLAKATHLVTRFFDAIGKGDGMLIFLRKR
jgi:2-polyprenyl-3-methyl-5-hydroxy-6-metoxy-1,4-benzoquinol methylase